MDEQNKNYRDSSMRCFVAGSVTSGIFYAFIVFNNNPFEHPTMGIHLFIGYCIALVTIFIYSHNRKRKEDEERGRSGSPGWISSEIGLAFFMACFCQWSGVLISLFRDFL